jgi:hypothetical protein
MGFRKALKRHENPYVGTRFNSGIVDCDVKLNSSCKKEAMIQNVESISLKNQNDGTISHPFFLRLFDEKKSESSLHRKRYFCSSIFFMEMEKVFVRINEGGKRLQK